MNKNIRFIALAMTLFLAACQQEQARGPEPPAPQPTDTHASSAPDSLRHTRRTTADLERQRLISAELDYYLSRHSVSDEGFDMVARYAEQGDSLLSAYMPYGPATPAGLLKLRTVPRRGMGLARDSHGRFIIGTWQADTLASGIRIDTAGVYAGQFDRYWQAHGHGSYRAADGSFFEGHFERDQRQGFGFSVSPHRLQAGIWRRGRFLGERMQHTSDRIYGIDISRYQHEQGRRRYAISWPHLRITSLGRRQDLQAAGATDYPVTFVYVKATEGLSIRNRYHAADCQGARRQGIHVGAYHFFSTRQSGRLQANYFLSQASLRRGDLPPMLDIEPSDALIRQMGGPEALFREVRAWVKTVEQRTGTRPLLYVNQRFVGKYLDEAPDLKQDYLIWIARYGEYKPDVHLAIWQLSASGHVSGIHGETDINVFNGYEGQWNEFLREEAIP